MNLKVLLPQDHSQGKKSGQTDDLVSATLLIMRIISVLKDWDPKSVSSFSFVADEDTPRQGDANVIFVSH